LLQKTGFNKPPVIFKVENVVRLYLLINLVNGKYLPALNPVIDPRRVVARQPIRPGHIAIINDERLPRALFRKGGE